MRVIRAHQPQPQCIIHRCEPAFDLTAMRHVTNIPSVNADTQLSRESWIKICRIKTRFLMSQKKAAFWRRINSIIQIGSKNT